MNLSKYGFGTNKDATATVTEPEMPAPRNETDMQAARNETDMPENKKANCSLDVEIIGVSKCSRTVESDGDDEIPTPTVKLEPVVKQEINESENDPNVFEKEVFSEGEHGHDV